MLNNVVGNKILAYKLIFVDWTRQTVDMKMKLLFFVKNGPSPASFLFIFVFSNKHYNFKTNTCEKM